MQNRRTMEPAINVATIKPMTSTPKNAGIKEIAEALGISIGTVDRALHDRRGVSLKTKAKVQKMADQLGYKPNLAAQALL